MGAKSPTMFKSTLDYLNYMCQSAFEKSKSFKSYGWMVGGGSYEACCILLNPSWNLRRACLAFCYLHINTHLCSNPTFC